MSQIKKEWFITNQKGNISDNYLLSQKKSISNFHTVSHGNMFKVFHKLTKQYRCIKIISKNKLKNHFKLIHQINILSQLVFILYKDHPNIIKLFETYEDEKYIYMILELCRGGQLYDRLIQTGEISQIYARQYFKQVATAINYCHIKNICHSDINPQNILFLSKQIQSPLKLTKFSNSLNKKTKNIKNTNRLVIYNNEIYYCSPQMLSGYADKDTDIWSLGICLYTMLSGSFPFFGNSDAQISSSIMNMKLQFDQTIFQNISQQAKDLIRCCLKQKSKRITINQLLQHPWLKVKLVQVNINIKNLEKYVNFDKFKKSVISFLAYQIPQRDIINLGTIFRQMDKDGDGFISIKQIQNAVKPTLKKQIQQMIKKLKLNQDSVINYTQFIASTLDKSKYLAKQNLRFAFQQFDLDKNGKISKQEMKRIFNNCQDEKNNEQKIDRIMNEIDINNDGQIDFNEFVEFMSKCE